MFLQGGVKDCVDLSDNRSNVNAALRRLTMKLRITQVVWGLGLAADLNHNITLFPSYITI